MVSIICCTMRQHFMENAFRNYESQDYREKELIIILNRDDMDRSVWEARARRSSNVTVFQLPESMTLGECLNFGVEQAKYPYVANKQGFWNG
ncbi:hypothetical protein BEP19_09475 [Ammoniphilus oxalaticus]|uniref:Glycosyltransferase 2-like domain-containing protein n=1 Tax=Ammoniphilus oxalaticus TaxID=66863 RepID=A0A419SKQ8_9BACL|nr:glycosyltransferase family A protein [Ammoniphilus oxalaticus]RKD24597.1 hypothetical protein BEP19_09475 [Ammoniphilus oxalaticus]